MGDRVTITKTCPICKARDSRSIDSLHYARWKGGWPIQEALRDLSAEEVEWFISGTHAECWDKAFG